MSQAPAPLRILHLTDPHLFADDAAELRGVVTAASLDRALDDYRGSGWSADRVIVTGDIAQDHSAGAYRRFVDALSGLGLPVHCVPGNHDVPDRLREACESAGFYYCAAVDCGDWLIMGLDSAVEGEVAGAVPADEAGRLRAAVEASDAKHVLVHLHHPPVIVGTAWLDAVGMVDVDGALERLRGVARVRGILFGHVHQAHDSTHNGLRILGTPSTCRQFLPGSEDYAVDDRPPAWRRVELGADGQIETQLVWIDEN